MHRNRGFTLTELLVVVAIIILLVAVSVPAFLSASRVGRLSAAVRSVQAALMAARNLAVAYNRLYSTEFGKVNDPNYDLRIDDDDHRLNDSDFGWAPGDQGYFVAVQQEEREDPTTQGDILAREATILPKGIVLAFDSTAADAEWTAVNGDWDNTGMPLQDDDCPDIAFQADGTCADEVGDTTVVLYDSSEEPDAEGNVTVAVITVVKYTGELIIEYKKAPLDDLK